MIRIDAVWLCSQPLDMRAGAERLLAHVVATLGACLQHWTTLSAHLHDGAVPIDNNRIERQIKP
jgi:transposase